VLDEISEAPPQVLAEVIWAAYPEARVGASDGRIISNVRLMMSDSIGNQDVVQRLCEAFDFNGTGPVKVRIPALRERVGDVPLLARYFANVFSARSGRRRIRITRDAMDRLVHYEWPGNVKELKEVIGRSVLLARNGIIDADCVRLDGGKWAGITGGGGPAKRIKPLKAALQKPEREYILAALRRTGWNKKRAAVELNVSRSTLYKKINKYKLDELGTLSTTADGDRERWVGVLQDRQVAD